MSGDGNVGGGGGGNGSGNSNDDGDAGAGTGTGTGSDGGISRSANRGGVRRYERCVWATLLSLLVDDYDGNGGGNGNGDCDEGYGFNYDEKNNVDDDHDDDDDDDNDDYDGGYYGNDDDNHVATPGDDGGDDMSKMGQGRPTGTELKPPRFPPFPRLFPGALVDHIQALDTLAALIDSPYGGTVMGATRLVLVLLQVRP